MVDVPKLSVFWIALALGTLVGCGDDADAPAAEERATSTSAPPTDASGDGRALDAPLLTEPPVATGDRITAEQAEGVSGTVVAAWLDGDRARADRFATTGEVLDALFALPPPSRQLSGGDGGWCSDSGGGDFTGCSYGVVDDSADGILALSTELEIVDGRVLVRDAGFADWND